MEPDTAADAPMTKRSERDLDLTAVALQRWLVGKLGAAAQPVVAGISAPSANGMSSESLMLDATWTDGDTRGTHQLVARVAPAASAVPVFPSYHLDQQYALLEKVADAGVPVPPTRWLELDESVIGSPFFVMDRVAGRVPPDVMPYNFGSWVSEGTDDQRDTMMRSTLSTLAAIHAIPDPAASLSFLGPPGRSARDALAAHLDEQHVYYEWAREQRRIPVIERGLDWLRSNLPKPDGAAVLCWGDSRIGNVIYGDDWRPAAILDWEMAALGPPELDVSWFIFLHRFFEDIAHQMELPGLANFLRRDDVEAAYVHAGGRGVNDLDWYLTYAAVRHGIVMARTQLRAIHFGEIVEPDDPDHLVMHRATIDAMLDGTYWANV